MTKRWSSGDIQIGALMTATFWPNPVREARYRFQATHLDGRKAPKVVLCDDGRIRPGFPCRVKVTSVHKPRRDDRGYIEVEFVSQEEFKIEGVYLDPVVAKKLQVLLKSGLNILKYGHNYRHITLQEKGPGSR